MADFAENQQLAPGGGLVNVEEMPQDDDLFALIPGVGIVKARAAAAGGGPTFEQAVAGSITPIGSLGIKVKFAAGVTGSSTPSGAVIKRVRTGVSGSVTPSGATVKKTAKGVSGSISPSGSVLKKVGKAVAGSLAPAGALYVTWKQALAGSTTPSGSLASQLIVKSGIGGIIVWLRRRRKAP